MNPDVSQIIEILEADYPDALCSLTYGADYQLLFAARLSAQCTDKRVNEVTPLLFSRYPTLKALAEADVAELEDIIHPCGFFRIKSRDIIGAAQLILSSFGGKVPGTMDDLLKLPGVGRKTANLMLGDIYGEPAIVADTHCIRISNRLGLCESKDPVKVEMQLKEIIPPEKQSDFCHRLVLHGRAMCLARNPACGRCSLSTYCAYHKPAS